MESSAAHGPARATIHGTDVPGGHCARYQYLLMPILNHKRTPRFGGLCGLVLALACLACSPPPPSIVVVTLDTLRTDHVGAYGQDPSLTPNLDRLAEEGLVHDAAFTTMPTTGPAHLSLFTGLYPSEHGATRNAVPLSPQHATRDAALQLRNRGYATGAFVTSWLAGRDATGLEGFGAYNEPRSMLRPGSDAVDTALAWLDENTGRPTLIWVHLYDAHAPYGDLAEKGRSFPVDEQLYGWLDEERFASGDLSKELAARYARGVADADAALGQLLDGLRQRGEDPLVIVAADHGESLDEHRASRGYGFDHGEFLDEEAVRIPLVIAGPGVTPGRSAGTASIRDLYTTILEAGGIGDATAVNEGRRDLRQADDTPRIVEVERRSFDTEIPDLVARHAAGASDGSAFVVVAPSGEFTVGADGAAPELQARAAARARAAEEAKRRTLPQFDPETVEALRQLGYTE